MGWAFVQDYTVFSLLRGDGRECFFFIEYASVFAEEKTTLYTWIGYIFNETCINICPTISLCTHKYIKQTKRAHDPAVRHSALSYTFFFHRILYIYIYIHNMLPPNMSLEYRIEVFAFREYYLTPKEKKNNWRCAREGYILTYSCRHA